MAKLFGNTGGAYARDSAAPGPTAVKKPRRGLKAACCAAGVLAALYAFVVWAPFKPVEKLRNMYIETALSTMNHRWLATAFFPKSVVDQVRQQMNDAVDRQTGLSSDWGNTTPEGYLSGADGQPHAPLPTDTSDEAMEAFFDCFRELDRGEVLDWVAENPGLLEHGWGALSANEAGLEDDGLPIHTTRGDQVLAIDAVTQTLLIRVKGAGWRGVLAIAKDPSRFSLQAAATLGDVGQNAGVIAQAHDGVLAMTASGFLDVDGHGKGGQVTGFARCDGKDYGDHLRGGYKRLEKHADNRLYLTDAVGPVRDDVTDAMEFTPALIVDGKIVVDDTCGWTAVNPRACLGQNDRYEMMMLVVEGRLPTVSMGTSVVTCAQLLYDYGCVQAMNMDGGTSAILWYDGEYVTQCSNTALSAGRLLPNAWVYAR